MSTTLSRPQRLRAGSSRCADLGDAEGHGECARIAAPGTAPVSASTPEGRSTATTGTAGVEEAGQLGDAVRQTGPATDPEDAVDGDVVRRRRSVRVERRGRRSQPPSGGAAAPPGPACGVAQAGHGRDPSPPGGQPGAGEQGVARRCCPDRPGSAPALRTPGRVPGRARAATTAASPAAARCIRASSATPRMARCLEPAHLLDGVGVHRVTLPQLVATQASQITTPRRCRRRGTG